MKKSEMIYTIAIGTAIAVNTKITHAQAGIVYDSIIENIIKEMKKPGGEVPLLGLGVFKSVKRKARIGYNPQTKTTMKLKAKNSMKFVPSKQFTASMQ